MSQPVCVNCQNNKPVNLTDNRLVTENCGHVKCIECLVQEKWGCQACHREANIDASLEVVFKVPFEKGSDKKKPENKEVAKKPKPETSHIEVINDENGKCFLCTLCKKKFHARSQVVYHAYCNGQRKPFQCPECSKSFATHSHFKYHMQVHRNERTYSCEDCGESFFQMSKLQRHRLKHTKEKKYVCTECGKAFSDHTTLRKHALLHTGLRPYSCPCGRAFRDASNYRRHRAKHEVNHQPGGKCLCAVCGRAAGSRRALAAHARAHPAQERRAFPCPRCTAAFHSKKDLRRHSAVHTDSKPFRCKVCNRHFRRKDNLERHIRNTHPDSTPSAAVECEEGPLCDILANGKTPELEEKNMLQILNPLPPLPQEEIQKLTEVVLTDEAELTDVSVETSKSYIIEANNARESVIFGPGRKPKNPENEYVHKIRKANMQASKDIPLPPIDEKKIIELEKKSSSNNLDIGMPSNNMEVYKKILYERMDSARDIKSEERNGDPGHSGCEMHWRRRLKLNINWSVVWLIQSIFY